MFWAFIPCAKTRGCFFMKPTKIVGETITELDCAQLLMSQLRCCWLSGMLWAFIPCAITRDRKVMKEMRDKIHGFGWWTSFEISIEVFRCVLGFHSMCQNEGPFDKEADEEDEEEGGMRVVGFVCFSVLSRRLAAALTLNYFEHQLAISRIG